MDAKLYRLQYLKICRKKKEKKLEEKRRKKGIYKIEINIERKKKRKKRKGRYSAFNPPNNAFDKGRHLANKGS